MLIVVIFLIIGSILAYLSHDNLMPVSVMFGPYVFYDIPLFYVIVGSVVTGLLVSYLLHVLYVISTSLRLRSKEKELKKSQEEVLELTKRVHQLELEKEKHKRGSAVEPADRLAL